MNLSKKPKMPKIWGILNLTPDSFYDGGRYIGLDKALARGIQLAEEGADVIDVGGESTRPGAEKIDENEELRRIIPVIANLSEMLTIPISVDTYKARVAEKAFLAGATILNDISGLTFDPEMKNVIAKWDFPFVIMHIQGIPKNMQIEPHYTDVTIELKEYFLARLNQLESANVNINNAILDPGIGFGKLLEHNMGIFKSLDKFIELGHPIMIGASRKSFLPRLINLPLEVEERLSPSLAVAAHCYFRGVEYLRVHDVKDTKIFLQTLSELLY